MEIIDHLKKVISTSGRKSYTFVMGKLNVAKMANFMEVDCYVLVACPENSLIDSKVITAFLLLSIIITIFIFDQAFIIKPGVQGENEKGFLHIYIYVVAFSLPPSLSLFFYFFYFFCNSLYPNNTLSITIYSKY